MNNKKNFVFIMTDQHNPDYVSYSKAAKVDTPNIDFIAQGTVFENAVTPNPVCTPARCALLTGKYPHQVGMMTTSGCLNTNYPTYARALKKSGYNTAAVGKLHLMQGWHWNVPVGQGHDLVELKEETKKYGFDYVWETAGKGLMLKNYCDYAKYLDKQGLLAVYRNEVIRRDKAGGHPEYPDTAESFGISEENHVEQMIANKAISFIKEQDKEKPFSLLCSFLSPHPIIDPPSRFLEMEGLNMDEEFLLREGQKELSDDMKKRWCENRRGYRALIRFIDYQIGRIIDVLKAENILSETILVFTSDHGDVLGNYRIDGKNLPWRESSTVPLAIRHPDFVNGIRVEDPVSLIDIPATILDIAEIDYEKALSLFWPVWNHVVPCKSLLPIIKGDTKKVRDFTFTENDGFEMIQTKNYKYIRYRTMTKEYSTPKEKLFDLQKDKSELTDVSKLEGYSDVLKWCREMRDYTLNSTPAGQMGWAPVRD
ncbi:MAG TPA: hypothetical protein DIW17_14055, partial [Clostridiales bacterium]|nr:hypothetical protein [Clostridiales bacterium]